MSNRADQIRRRYGFPFPEEFFECWDWYQGLDEDARRTLGDVMGMAPVGAFDVLAGRFDGVEPLYPTTLHWRYQFDPPEFFTLFVGDTDGLHWGFWFDNPGERDPVVAHWYARDAFELTEDGNSIFDAIRNRLESCREGATENLEDDPDYADAYRADLEALEKLEAILPKPAGGASRHATEMALDGGMGIVVPPGASAEAVDLLVKGKRLWEKDRRAAFDTLEEAYTLLGRPVLAEVVRAHREHPALPDLDILTYKRGDYDSLEDALAEPDNVVSLELGGKGLTEFPDVSAMVNLEVLALYGNQITEIPESLLACPKLRELNLHRNALTVLPKFLEQLPELNELIVSENQINRIEVSMDVLAAMDSFVPFDNPLPDAELEKLRRAFPD